MGLLNANQVNRKVLLGGAIAVAAPAAFASDAGAQIADYIVLAAAIDNTDAADQYVEMALLDPFGNLAQLGAVIVPAPAAPSDQTVVNLADPTGDLNLAGLVVPAGWVLEYRAQPGYTTGAATISLTVGVA